MDITYIRHGLGFSLQQQALAFWAASDIEHQALPQTGTSRREVSSCFQKDTLRARSAAALRSALQPASMVMGSSRRVGRFASWKTVTSATGSLASTPMSWPVFMLRS